ncbi:MAG: DUF1778 domain-containing protein [Acidimicrobiia bacterium]|nr:DUF1778 domain-containing protein [Acidimicrobiia bacterium]MYC44640.1 DUF1778 domain-containing protein [Acidimicrobiia bacterium]MYI20565.1 DUF1778 domain-containing protein [Acidimicrobiia bacterium]
MTTNSERHGLHGLADQQIFVLEPPAWDELQEALNRPPTRNPRITALLAQPSTLEAGRARRRASEEQK